MGEVTNKTWNNRKPPAIMAEDLNAIEAGIVTAWDAAADALAEAEGRAPADHTHTITEVDGLQAALDSAGGHSPGTAPARGAGLSATGATLALTRYTDGRRALRVSGTATGTSAVVATVVAADRPAVLTLCDGWLTDAAAANAWPATISAAGVVTLLATPPAGTALSGVLEWRIA